MFSKQKNFMAECILASLCALELAILGPGSYSRLYIFRGVLSLKNVWWAKYLHKESKIFIKTIKTFLPYLYAYAIITGFFLHSITLLGMNFFTRESYCPEELQYLTGKDDYWAYMLSSMRIVFLTDWADVLLF
jgi:hypothetical protein